MIRLMEDFVPWDIYSARTLAAYRNYGDGQFWLQDDTAAISLIDGFMVVSAKDHADWEELAAFLRMQPWSRLQCDANVAARLPFPVDWASVLFKFKAPPLPCTCTPTPTTDVAEVYEILSRCNFPEMKNRAEWMADLALRWRKDTAQTWTLDNACTVSALALTEGFCYLGALGTLPEARGKGLAGKLLAGCSMEQQTLGRTVWLTCREELTRFYVSVGFERTGTMATLGKGEPQ